MIFNYGAEPPSFIISTTGIAIWYVAGRRTRLQGVLLGLMLALVTGEGLGIWPQAIRHGWMDESRIRVIPVVAAWIAMQWELLGWRTEPASAPAPEELEPEPELALEAA